MSKTNIIRSWKDADFRDSLSDAERALLPENPAGLVELTDEVLSDVVGGQSCLCWSNCGQAPQEEPQQE